MKEEEKKEIAEEKDITEKDTRKKRKFSESIIGIILIAIVLLIIGEIFGELVTIPLTKLIKSDKIASFVELYFSFIGIYMIFALYFWRVKKDRYILKKLPFKINHFIIGLIVGGTLNLLCAFGAMLNKELVITFNGANILIMIFAFVLVTIQSTAEELLCRLFIYQKLKKSYKSAWIPIIVSSVFFGLMHTANPGIGILPILNITIYGLFMAVVIYYVDSFWTVAAIHTAWNYMQNFLLGLPNSGMEASYSLYKAVLFKSGFFYDEIFGLEGPIFCTILLSLATLTVYLVYRNKDKKVANKEA